MKKFLTFVLVLAMVMSVSSVALAAGGTFGGSGTETEPYLIEDLDDLKAFRDSVNSGNNYAGEYVKLAASIDMSSVDNWTPIGDTTYKTSDYTYDPVDNSKVFNGVFDGNGKVLSNLKIEKTVGDADNDANLGLFGIIGDDAIVKNLTITNVDINTDGRNVGALAGVAYATIDNITVNGNIQIKGGNNVSGVCGMSRYHDVSMTNITVSGNDGSVISGNNIVGGIFAEIAPNSSAQTFSNLSVENVTINGVGGVGGIVGLLTNGAISDVSVKNVVLTGKTEWNGDSMGRIRLGSVVGLLGSGKDTYSTVSGVTVQNVTGKNLDGDAVTLPDVGANYTGSVGNATEAKVGDKYYAKLDKAVEAAQDGDTITLLTDYLDISDVTTDKDVTVVDSKGNIATIKDGVKIYPVNLNFGTKQIGYSGVTAQTVTIEGATSKPVVTVNNDKYNIGEVQDSSGNYTFTVQPKDGLGLGVHNASITVTVDVASPSPAIELGTIEAEFTVESKPSSGSGISVKYNGGNSFSTSNPAVPTGVEIDGVPVTFNGNGSNFSVGCISSDAKWVTVRWNSTSVTTNFTPDGLVECTTVSIPKTGDMSIWAAVAAFFGF